MFQERDFMEKSLIFSAVHDTKCSLFPRCSEKVQKFVIDFGFTNHGHDSVHTVPAFSTVVTMKRMYVATLSVIAFVAKSIYFQCKSIINQIGTETTTVPDREYIPPQYLRGQRRESDHIQKRQKSVHSPSELPSEADSYPTGPVLILILIRVRRHTDW